MIRTYKLCIAILLCACSFSFAQTDEDLKPKNVFVISGTNIPDSVMQVMNYCTEVWSQYISSDVPIQVSVSLQELKRNVNAYAKPTNYYAIEDVYYPVALAEKKKGKNLNGSDADIEVVINKTMNWYLKTDEIPESLPKGVYDLTTTLLHELAHGLGFIGSIDNATATTLAAPTIFDMFVVDSTGALLVTKDDNTYKVNNQQLTSDSLFWNGQFAKLFCGETIELYAPEKFNSGSTVYHLNEVTYPSGSGFELLTPQLDNSEIFRTPDLATISILADIGWNDYFIASKEPLNSSDFQANTKLSFSINESFIQKDKQMILYSFDGGKHLIELLPEYSEETSMFEAEVPALQFDHTISYKIRSLTTNGDTLFLPNKDAYFSVYIGDDNEAPTIEHTPIISARATVNEVTSDIVFTAEINDNFEIDSAYVELYTTDESSKSILKFPSSGLCSVSLSFPPGANYAKGDVLHYRIVAVDKTGNTSMTNDGEFFVITFEEPLDAVRYFEANFDDENAESYFTLDKFSIKKENGFQNKALHTEHPYAYTGLDGKYNQYTATIKQPIIIAKNPATLTFDEVVLVEPGKAGISFGSFGFWDYVIVEGSKDSENWYALGKTGWDSQIFSDWKNRYYSSTKNDGSNENSLAVGDSTLFKKHTINLLENKYFRTGDTIFVRFRLQSDATNYAWGWAIDNIQIQERMKLSVPYIQNSAVVYPNPCKNTLYIETTDLASVKLYDKTGALVLSSKESPVDVSQLPTGIYVVAITNKDGKSTSQLIVIQK
ncbi:MAG: T9SS type A sorting domain-containing protein [Bacteroidales bacterium]|nr:T9SS type A sorting domain-containing protein [Bacteroidales bacterium]